MTSTKKKSDAVLIAELEAKTARNQEMMRLLTNPLVLGVSAWVVVDVLDKNNVIGMAGATMLRGMIAGYPLVTNLDEIIGATTKIISAVGMLKGGGAMTKALTVA